MRYLSIISLASLVLVTSCGGPPKARTTATATISGTVLESDTDKPVIGASVLLKGYQRGCMTDREGAFLIHIPDLPRGKHTLIVSCIGYIKTPVDITVTENGVTTPPIHLAPAPSDLGLGVDLTFVTGNKTGTQ